MAVTPHADPLAIYRMACCGLQAAQAVLEANGLPTPAVSQIRADGPVGRCCAELVVTPKGAELAYETSSVSGLEQDCVTRVEWVFEVCMSRCVSDWFGNTEKCTTADGDCTTILTCDPDDPWTPPEKCGKKGVTQADEHALVLADRLVLMSQLPGEWACCLGDPDAGCGDCNAPEMLACSTILVTDVRDYCEAGCVGTILEVRIS